jgi:enamine deaminase RidA (YjgF/YER057c/UK114 family)
MNIEENLKKAGITLPVAAAPAANYVAYLVSDDTVYISGQLPIENGKIAYEGKVGKDVDIQTAQKAARACAINILAQLKAALNGDLSKVKQCAKLGIFVNAIDTFKDHAQVGNGASDLIVEILEEKGKHARAAVGSSSLPFGVPVEIDAIFICHPTA